MSGRPRVVEGVPALAATAVLVIAVVLLMILLHMFLLLTTGAGWAVAAEPSPEPTMTAAGVLSGGDPRSEGEGPGIIGSPLAIFGAVIALGIATALVTVIVARLGRRD